MSARRDTVELAGQPTVGDGSEADPPAGGPSPTVPPAIPEQLRREREANRWGPAHPNHWGHQQWLDERALTKSWDELWYSQHPLD
jgi:hypothetical protein